MVRGARSGRRPSAAKEPDPAAGVTASIRVGRSAGSSGKVRSVQEATLNSIVYIVGAVVIVIAILSFLGLR